MCFPRVICQLDKQPREKYFSCLHGLWSKVRISLILISQFLKFYLYYCYFRVNFYYYKLVPFLFSCLHGFGKLGKNVPVLKLKRVVKALFPKFSFILFSAGSLASNLAVLMGFMICLLTLLTCKGIIFCKPVYFYYRFNSVLSFE